MPGDNDCFNPVPALSEALAKEGIDSKLAKVCVDVNAAGMIEIKTRESVIVSDKQKSAVVEFPSLASLFRGDAQAPQRFEPGKLPEKYMLLFRSIERCVLAVIDFGLHPFDGQFEEIYSQMRRRPDGRSLGLLHDIVWQAAALEMAKREWNQDELAFAFKILSSSAKRHRSSKDARNYIGHLKEILSVRNISIKGA